MMYRSGQNKTNVVDVPVVEVVVVISSLQMTTMVKYVLEVEFTAPYRDAGDDAPAQLEAHVRGCWLAYARQPYRFVAPSVALVQSSGFGKSRLVYELARRTKAASHDMRVLYTCGGDETAYPLWTRLVCGALFPLQSEWGAYPVLEDVLSNLFTRAMTRWDSVGEEWFALITDREIDTKTYDLVIKQHSPAESLSQEEIDEADDKPCTTPETQRLLVFTLDAASVLLDQKGFMAKSWFYMFEDALVIATSRIRARYGPYAGIMALLVDQDLRIVQASNHNAGDPFPKPFPPFILTQTMDAFYNELMRKPSGTMTRMQRHQQQVFASEDEAHQCLAAMGRPLWRSRLDALGFDQTVQVAAAKLLAGTSAKQHGCLTEENVFGVASVLSRVGLRPMMWSPLAPRLVAASLAVLSYVGAGQGPCVSSHSTEPVVAFGAARVWYQSQWSWEDPLSNLDKHLVPHLRKLLENEQIDGSSGCHLIVARMVLLLVMDTIGVVKGAGNPGKRMYQGDFYRVQDFLKVLRGVDVNGEDPIELHDPELVQWLTEWNHWYIGFSHFVELTGDKQRGRPSDDYLWAMLARRAACLTGQRLWLPIFTRGDHDKIGQALVSVLQVTVAAPSDDGDAAKFSRLAESATGLGEVRISMDLSERRHARGFYRLRQDRETHEARSASSLASYGLEIQGLAMWSAHVEGLVGRVERVPVMSQEVAKELSKLLENDPVSLTDVAASGPLSDEFTSGISLVAPESLVDLRPCGDTRPTSDMPSPKKGSKRARRSKA